MLLDVAAMGEHLSDLLGERVTAVRIRYIDYEPGAALTVQYDAKCAAAGSPVVEAHARTTGAGWQAWVYPNDPALPLLAEDPGRLAAFLGLAPADSPVTRLAWVPQRRAVLRYDDVVVKLYADRAELRCAERALRVLDGALPTAALLSVHAGRGAVVQRALGGRPLRRDDALAVLRSVLLGSCASCMAWRSTASRIFARRSCSQPQAVRLRWRPSPYPNWRNVIGALTEHLIATMPEVVDVVPVHGDFNVGQLLADGDRIMVVDVDTLAEGSAAVDIAAYAANLHNGRGGDDDDVAAALTGLIEAYGSSPPDLNWHLAATMLRRVDRPIRRLKKRWPDRVGTIVSAIEAVLRGAG